MILNIVMFIFLVLSCLISCTIAPVNMQQHVERVIETTDGRIRGVLVEFLQDHKLKKIEIFFNIPYASLKGVRGNVLRFMPPSSPSKWKYIKDTSKHNSSVQCPQKWLSESKLMNSNIYERVREAGSIRKQDEECLYLNLFVSSQGKYKII
ncbi:hypothetical protein ACJMK2_017887 [Sinanodonta woodiana]|uniref:Carboxylesterase type B domain-containing protein n=1 Tax=Sinanodonta woodiana TaxID=1069815 RepID=A0ABD3UBR0_SINWO